MEFLMRRTTRLCAVQTLYSSELAGKMITQQIESTLSDKKIFLDEEKTVSLLDVDFFKNLLNAYEAHAEKIDEIISKNLSESWYFDRLGCVMLSILRLGVAEIGYMLDIPNNVIFNEYIEITKAFFGESESSFVNGILNTIAKNCRKHPFATNEEISPANTK